MGRGVLRIVGLAGLLASAACSLLLEDDDLSGGRDAGSDTPDAVAIEGDGALAVGSGQDDAGADAADAADAAPSGGLDIANPGFEESFVPTGCAPGWVAEGATANPSLTRHSGNRACRLCGQGKLRSVAPVPVGVGGGARIAISAWARLESGGGGLARVGYRAFATAAVIDEAGPEVPVSAAFVRVALNRERGGPVDSVAVFIENMTTDCLIVDDVSAWLE